MFQLIDSKFQIIQRKEKRLGITDKNSKADDGEGERENAGFANLIRDDYETSNLVQWMGV